MKRDSFNEIQNHRGYSSLTRKEYREEKSNLPHLPSFRCRRASSCFYCTVRIYTCIVILPGMRNPGFPGLQGIDSHFP